MKLCRSVRRRLISLPNHYVIVLLILLAVFLFYMGVFTHLFEKDYHTEFSYPLDMDVMPLVRLLQDKERTEVKPINVFTYSYLKSCRHKCPEGSTPRLVFVIKSAVPNFERREAIRQTWGYEKRFSDVDIRRVFLLGRLPSLPEQELAVDREDDRYGDIVQADFIDSYGNNTLKTMSGLKWVVENCSGAQFIVFADDDMYLSAKNVLRFVRQPFDYPQEDEPVLSRGVEHRERSLKQQLDDVQHSDTGLAGDNLSDFKSTSLYAGYVFHSPPLRHRSSKWYVSLAEYPYHLWPPYVTAGAYILSRQTLLDLHYGSQFTQYFRFDDVFLGLVARKARIEPVHCPQFYFWKKPYSSSSSYRHVIASHGYSDPDELKRVWSEQKSAGNA